MQTDLNICGENYTKTVYVICLRSKQLKDDPDGWMFKHKYTDLGKAKLGLKDIINRNTGYEYKIRKFVIKGTDLITDEIFPFIENRDTCVCFHCGKTIKAGDDLVFDGDIGKVYCSHECAVSLNRDNKHWTALSDPDEYLPWFPEKEYEDV